MLENILIRWKFILDQFEEEPKKLLAKELCKITPSKPNFEVDWRMSDSYQEDQRNYIFNFTIIVRPVFHAQELEIIDLFDYFSKLISTSSAEDLKHLEKNLKFTKMDLPYRLENSLMPCMDLGSEVGMIKFRIVGKNKGYHEKKEGKSK